MDVRSYKNGQVYYQEYRRGEVVADLKVIGETDRSGTTGCHFTPDPEIFTETTEFDFTKLNKRIQELTNSKPWFKSFDLLTNGKGFQQTKEYHYEGGIASYVEYLNENKDVIFETPIYTEGEMEGITVEVSMQYTTSYP